MTTLTEATQDVLAERKRQIEKHGGKLGFFGVPTALIDGVREGGK